MFIDLRDGRALVVWDLPGEAEPIPFGLAKYRAQSVQVSGEFFGGRVTLEGSNDEEEYCPLSDPNGNPLVFYSPKIEQILEDCVKIVPKLVGPPEMKVKVSVLLFQVR